MPRRGSFAAAVGLATALAVSVAMPGPAAQATQAHRATRSPAPVATWSDPTIGAGLPDDGTLLPPTRNVAAVLRQQSAAPAPSRAAGSRSAGVPAPPFTYATSGYLARALPPESLPYSLTTPVPLTDTGLHDAQGVRLVRIGSTNYNHPVAQAQYGLANLASYRITNNSTYLARATAQAQRLVDTKIVSRGAWFFPYTYDFALHGMAADTMRAPWYSAMAEGQALSLFVRLYQVTQDQTWLSAADSTAASFVLPSSPTLPWVVHVDAAHHLWLDEFPVGPGERADLTFNGHNFAAFGLYDYLRQTGDPVVADLFDGAVTTTKTYAQSYRNPTWISSYCLTHHTPAGHYHDIHIDQLLNLYAMTGDSGLAGLSDAFRADFPHNGTSTVRLAAGRHTGYTFNSAGAITGSRTMTLNAVSTAPSSDYFKIKNRSGLYLRISGGTLAGLWVPEQPGVATAVGPFETADYVPERVATLPVGPTTGYLFGADGMPSSSTTIVLSQPETAASNQSSTFNGVRYARISAGSLTGYWVPMARAGLLPATAFGDFSEDGWSDLIARQRSTGALYSYPGTGMGFGARVRIGTGWNGMSAITRFGDFTGDGHEDLIAAQSATGALWLYPGSGTGGFAAPVKVGSSGWNGMREITAAGDVDGDGHPDLLAVQASTGYLFLYPGHSTSLGSPRRIGTGWNAMSELAGFGDLNHDGYVDLLARRDATGELWLYPGTASGRLGARVLVGARGWNGMRDLVGVGDINRDGDNDLIAVQSATGNLYLYPGHGTSFAPGQVIGTGWTTDYSPLL